MEMGLLHSALKAQRDRTHGPLSDLRGGHATPCESDARLVGELGEGEGVWKGIGGWVAHVERSFTVLYSFNTSRTV